MDNYGTDLYDPGLEYDEPPQTQEDALLFAGFDAGQPLIQRPPCCRVPMTGTSVEQLEALMAGLQHISDCITAGDAEHAMMALDNVKGSLEGVREYVVAMRQAALEMYDLPREMMTAALANVLSVCDSLRMTEDYQPEVPAEREL